MQTLCFIGNKKPPCGVDLQGGMLYRRDAINWDGMRYECMEIFFWILAGTLAMFLRWMIARYGRPGRGWMKYKKKQGREKSK